MAKRFIDTGIFDDTWFMDLSKDAKIAWLYLITKCDHAGIIEINEKLIILQTGIKSWPIVRQELNSRLINLRDKYFFIPKFIQFQYPNFPKSNVNQQSGAIKRLCEFGLFRDGQVVDLQALNSSLTLSQDLAKSYGNGNVYINNKEDNNKTYRITNLSDMELKTEKLKELWLIWLEYKKTQFGFSFKSHNSELTGFNVMLKLSNNNPLNAEKIINNSISNGYKGLFELKQSNNQPQQSQSRMAFEQNIKAI
jgi:hypothetical protein